MPSTSRPPLPLPSAVCADPLMARFHSWAQHIGKSTDPATAELGHGQFFSNQTDSLSLPIRPPPSPKRRACVLTRPLSSQARAPHSSFPQAPRHRPPDRQGARRLQARLGCEPGCRHFRSLIFPRDDFVKASWAVGEGGMYMMTLFERRGRLLKARRWEGVGRWAFLPLTPRSCCTGTNQNGARHGRLFFEGAGGVLVLDSQERMCKRIARRE